MERKVSDARVEKMESERKRLKEKLQRLDEALSNLSVKKSGPPSEDGKIKRGK